jgi:uncharacterized Zn finger protein
MNVTCKKCGHESVDPLRRGRQKYCQVRCIKCGYTLPNRRHGRDPFQDRRRKHGK